MAKSTHASSENISTAFRDEIQIPRFMVGYYISYSLKVRVEAMCSPETSVDI
jgi:hypothetical protein